MINHVFRESRSDFGCCGCALSLALSLCLAGSVGRIPREIGELRALEALGLAQNGLTGAFRMHLESTVWPPIHFNFYVSGVP